MTAPTGQRAAHDLRRHIAHNVNRALHRATSTITRRLRHQADAARRRYQARRSVCPENRRKRSSLGSDREQRGGGSGRSRCQIARKFFLGALTFMYIARVLSATALALLARNRYCNNPSGTTAADHESFTNANARNPAGQVSESELDNR